jgi:hypothetical protein
MMQNQTFEFQLPFVAGVLHTRPDFGGQLFVRSDGSERRSFGHSAPLAMFQRWLGKAERATKIFAARLVRRVSEKRFAPRLGCAPAMGMRAGASTPPACFDFRQKTQVMSSERLYSLCHPPP